MKKSSKKQVIFRLENTCTSVIVRYGNVNESTYVVEIRSFYRPLVVRHFMFSRDYEAFIFENFGYMIIPSYQQIYEGTRLFVY